MRSLTSQSTALIIALATLAIYAWLYRYELSPAGSAPGYVYVLDRWTGKLHVVRGREIAEVYEE